jgi:hypothetical protein
MRSCSRRDGAEIAIAAPARRLRGFERYLVIRSLTWSWSWSWSCSKPTLPTHPLLLVDREDLHTTY